MQNNIKKLRYLFGFALAFIVLVAVVALVTVPPQYHLWVQLGFVVLIAALAATNVFQHLKFRERAALLDTVMASVNDGIVVTEANLDAPGPIITYVNEAFTQISGYDKEEVIGSSPRFLQGEFTKRETLDALKEALKAGKPFKGELLNYHKNGTQYWLGVSIVPIHDSDGKITHFAAIERDITERKKQDEEYKNAMIQLKRANLKAEAAARDLQENLHKAEEANKAKGDFLANMSHELRTPMNGVLGMAHLLEDTALSGEQEELVHTINSSGENLLSLLNDILDISKIESNALQLENIAYDLKDLLSTTSTLLKPAADKKAVDVRLDVAADAPHYVWGDPVRIRQVITNLMGNSIKFTDHGYVELHAKLSEDTHGEPLLYVSVEDTGLGIPEDKIEQIFDKFTQADTSVTRKFGGTGLGLAITKQLVAMMGGTMGVESAVGKGSTFWFTLPIEYATEADLPKDVVSLDRVNIDEHKKVPIAEAKALLVEDYPVNQVFAEKLLRKFGFTAIDLAENGLEALKQYDTKQYDVIFMDCQMPELDGYQTTVRLRQIEEGTAVHTPIVAMTANAMVGDREKCLKAGMDAYTSKPLRAEHLKNILDGYFVFESNAIPSGVSEAQEAVSDSSAEAPVDLSQLRLFTDGDPDEEKELVDMFLEQAAEIVDVLSASITDDKHEEWKSAAHRFKGSSGNLGAMTLHHLCKRAEQDFEASEEKKIEMLVAIKQEMKRAEEFLSNS